MKPRIRLLAPLILLALSPATLTALAGAPGIAVLQAWARATPPGASVGGAYFTLVNDGPADTLVGVESPVSPRAEMHSMSMHGDMMQMRPVASVTVPAHGRVRFTPSGLHVMLLDLRQPLRQGGRLPLTLVFRKAGRVTVDAVIGGFGDESPPGPDGHGGRH